MEIEIREYKGNMIIAPSGDVDMHSSPSLRKELLKQIDGKVPCLIIDFGNVSYIDSSGIATFVEGLKTMQTYGGQLKLTGMPDDIIEIFKFSRLDSIFEIYPNIDDALKS